MKSFKKNIILLLLALAIVIAPLIFTGDSDFEGADGQAEGVITEISPDYEPWHEPFWEPPSGEIESLLFSSQAAVGALLIGYSLGIFREKYRKNVNH